MLQSSKKFDNQNIKHGKSMQIEKGGATVVGIHVI